ncbi:hypothetical protein HS088_TW04G00681 [Tripterygium wilfordii]|uniref:Uncharacterized protein n=1 Tax=Tripterygium wilfordii TaxID=458696 RepID=A0A7J7DR06_TRIWF|nr:hypothetical protein HS088_TW04G00681 [Tripterygium wilfordii]
MFWPKNPGLDPDCIRKENYGFVELRSRIFCFNMSREEKEPIQSLNKSKTFHVKRRDQVASNVLIKYPTFKSNPYIFDHACTSYILVVANRSRDYVWRWCRIREGYISYRFRVRCDGIHRVLREDDVHPYQQHHRWIWLVQMESLKYAVKQTCASISHCKYELLVNECTIHEVGSICTVNVNDTIHAIQWYTSLPPSPSLFLALPPSVSLCS